MLRRLAGLWPINENVQVRPGAGLLRHFRRYDLYLVFPLSICSCLSEKPKYQPSNLPPDAWMVASKLCPVPLRVSFQ